MYMTSASVDSSAEKKETRGLKQKLTSMLSKGVYFVQTEDGSIPSTYYSREEDPEMINSKKAIISVFQANFKGTKEKLEADPQSIHKAKYRYSASAQDVANGVVRMSRKVTNSGVKSYAHHMPKDEVTLKKKENMVYKGGVLTKAQGKTDCKLMEKKNEGPKDDTEVDNLEAEYRRKRGTSGYTSQPQQDPEKIKTYDPNLETNHYETKGSYTLRLVGQRRLGGRERRSMGQTDFTNMLESSLLGFINETRRDMERIDELREELGDITEALEMMHENQNNSDIAHKLEHLIKLEANRGPPKDETPAINDVLDYLSDLSGSNESSDINMRMLLYFIISPEGSIRSQMALLDGLKNAVNDEEKEAVAFYLALVDSPQPEFVAKLEGLISSDPHSTDPLLLVYGAIVPNASPELQHRMVLFLTNGLPEAETNSTSLIHHILSLGNSGSLNISNYLIDYLQHPETDIQLMAIFAMRFMIDHPPVEQCLKDFLVQPQLTEDHLTVMAKSLMYGCEMAMMKTQPKPYSKDLAESLVALSVKVDDEEFHSALQDYLKAVDTEDSLELLQFMNLVKEGETFTNTTRFERGTQWNARKDVYNLVASYNVRNSDIRRYQRKLSYIWGKRFGAKKINLKIAAGGFAGVSSSGDYKLFGRAVAKAQFFNRGATIIDFLVLRQKTSRSTLSRLYIVLLGRTLINYRRVQDPSVCMTIPKNLYRGNRYTLFRFTYSIFVVVGTLNFELKSTIQFKVGMYVRFCDKHGKVTAAAGLTPTLTIRVSAGGNLEIVRLAKAGLTLQATFNYQVIPEVSTEFCYKRSRLRVKNCIGVYHQWTNNKIELYAWYAWRGWCGWWFCKGRKAYRKKRRIRGLSATWKLRGTRRRTIWKTCDSRQRC
ncbi:hypothetical protein GBAR_LOCUS12470 [Geodia barretti]|nr:hypothetical protein GBAR_LOCUS12470 [Geodia barretti]